MRHIREILRLKWRLQRSHRETARSLGISPGAVASVISRATAIGLTWDAFEGVSDDALEQRLYGPKVTGRAARPRPDPATGRSGNRISRGSRRDGHRHDSIRREALDPSR